MSTDELLRIEPLELRFAFELKKQMTCSLQLSNKTDKHVAFKVKTTNPKKYCVRPNTGVVQPRSTCDVLVTMQVQREAPSDLQCKDKFLVQSVAVKEAILAKDVTAEMFSRESGNSVEEFKLKVIYVPPPQPPSPVPEGSEEGSSLRAASESNGAPGDLPNASKALSQSQEKITEVATLISKLTSEKNVAVQQNNKLRQELELLRRDVARQGGGFSFMFVVIVAVLGILLGYIIKK